MEKKNYYVASLSYGKDSLAMLIKIKELGLPLDEVIFCEIMFDDKISGIHPKQLEFINEARKILKERFDIDVIHLKAIKSYKEQFYTKKEKGKRVGEIYGFPVLIGAWCNSRLKLQVIAKHLVALKKQYNVIQYIGIASDEEDRIKAKENVIYPLVDLGITEEMAKDICINNNLLSPLYYSDIHRDGCWFCNKSPLVALRDIFANHKNLWNLLLELDNDSPYAFRANGETVHDLDERFKKETSQMTIFDFLEGE